jgi:energy-coupling factor transport system permease protein
MAVAANLAPNAPQKTRAFLARDPRFLMAGFALIAVSSFVIPHTRGLVVVLLYTLVLHRAANLPLASLLKTGRNLALFIGLIVVINGLLVEGRPLAPSFPFISREGLSSGIHASVRLLVLVIGAAVFFAATPAEEIAKGISALFAPVSKDFARRVAMYAFLSAGFLPLFADEIRRITVAQGFRGGGFGGGPFRKLRGVRLLIVPLILSAIHRSGELAIAVEVRRIRAAIGGILVLEKISRKDYLFLVATTVVVAAAGLVF